MLRFLILVVYAGLVTQTDCQLYNLLTPYHQPNPYPGGFLHSYASAVPGSSLNTISGGPVGSNLPPPEPPQVLLTHLNGGRPVQNSIPRPTPMSPTNFMNMVGGSSPSSSSSSSLPSSPSPSHPSPSTAGHNPAHPPHHGVVDLSSPGSPHLSQGGRPQGQGSSIPMTRRLKKVVTTLATSLGYRPYFEAHGCVDPTTVLRGQQAQMANLALMLGCNNQHAQDVCELAQVAHNGRGGAQMRVLMEYMLPKETKHMFEQCLSPTSLMSGMTSMLGRFSRQQGPVPPPGAALATDPMGGVGSHAAPPQNCGMISQMLMMSPSAAEGMMSPEAVEQIGVMRNKYFKMSCQENLLLGTLPYRMCCPGKVRPPSMQEAMMMRGMGGA